MVSKTPSVRSGISHRESSTCNKGPSHHRRVKSEPRCEMPPKKNNDKEQRKMGFTKRLTTHNNKSALREKAKEQRATSSPSRRGRTSDESQSKSKSKIVISKPVFKKGSSKKADRHVAEVKLKSDAERQPKKTPPTGARPKEAPPAASERTAINKTHKLQRRNTIGPIGETPKKEVLFLDSHIKTVQSKEHSKEKVSIGSSQERKKDLPRPAIVRRAVSDTANSSAKRQPSKHAPKETRKHERGTPVAASWDFMGAIWGVLGDEKTVPLPSHIKTRRGDGGSIVSDVTGFTGMMNPTSVMSNMMGTIHQFMGQQAQAVEKPYPVLRNSAKTTRDEASLCTKGEEDSLHISTLMEDAQKSSFPKRLSVADTEKLSSLDAPSKTAKDRQETETREPCEVPGQLGTGNHASKESRTLSLLGSLDEGSDPSVRNKPSPLSRNEGFDGETPSHAVAQSDHMEHPQSDHVKNKTKSKIHYKTTQEVSSHCEMNYDEPLASLLKASSGEPPSEGFSASSDVFSAKTPSSQKSLSLCQENHQTETTSHSSCVASHSNDDTRQSEASSESSIAGPAKDVSSKDSSPSRPVSFLKSCNNNVQRQPHVASSSSTKPPLYPPVQNLSQSSAASSSKPLSSHVKFADTVQDSNFSDNDKTKSSSPLFQHPASEAREDAERAVHASQSADLFHPPSLRGAFVGPTRSFSFSQADEESSMASASVSTNNISLISLWGCSKSPVPAVRRALTK